MKKILIISTDDEDGGSIETFNQIAPKLNLKVLGIVEDFATAMTYIKQTIPDLIICDVTLNEKYDSLEVLRKISAKFPIASILVTNDSNNDFVKHTQGIQIIGHLTKPLLLSQVKITVKVSLSSIS